VGTTSRIVASAVLGASILTSFAVAGPITPPPGPVGSTPGPEPRVAINATNTPGDSDSAYRIVTAGSYYLAGNLQGVSGRSGIEIAADNVSIDLNGFALVGGAGSLVGITTDAAHDNITIRNGIVDSWGSDGINFNLSGSGSNSIMEGLVTRGNAGAGIVANANALMRGCLSEGNAGAGISCAVLANLSECVARLNGGGGISVGNGSVLSNCTARDNGGTGLSAGTGSTIVACAAHSNDLNGISAGTNCAVVDCAVSSNLGDGIQASSSVTIADCSANSNLGDGIQVSSNCLVRGNTCAANGSGSSDGAGIHVTAGDNRIEGNNCIDADRGIDVDGTGNLIICNSASDNSIAFDIVAGNIGLFVAAVSGGAVNGSSGGAALGSTDPRANFAY
jgi:hypothetical protein